MQAIPTEPVPLPRTSRAVPRIVWTPTLMNTTAKGTKRPLPISSQSCNAILAFSHVWRSTPWGASWVVRTKSHPSPIKITAPNRIHSRPAALASFRTEETGRSDGTPDLSRSLMLYPRPKAISFPDASVSPRCSAPRRTAADSGCCGHRRRCGCPVAADPTSSSFREAKGPQFCKRSCAVVGRPQEMARDGSRQIEPLLVDVALHGARHEIADAAALGDAAAQVVARDVDQRRRLY